MISEGLHLTVLVGRGAPPPPLARDLLAALTAVSVSASTHGRTGFQLTFEADTPALVRRLHERVGLGVDPAIRVILVATLRGAPTVLIDGVITQHQHAPGVDGRATLTFTGEDLCCLMDLVDATGFPFPGSSIEAQVALILVRYLGLGVVGTIVPTPLIDVPNPTREIPRQKGTDLAHIQACAARVGYAFFLIPGPKPGMSLAYFGPEARIGPVQPALTVDMGPHTNVDGLSFTLGTQSRELPLITILVDKTTITIPALHLPFHPPLGAIPQPPLRQRRIPAAKLSPARAALVGAASTARGGDTVTASGKLDVLRYGHLLRARELVAVRGASSVYDGLYYVDSVTTELKPGGCNQSFSLSRTGVGSTVREVAV